VGVPVSLPGPPPDLTGPEPGHPEEAGAASNPVWTRPGSLNYPESLRGFGSVVCPLLAGFSLAAIATIVTSGNQPPLAAGAVAALAAAVGLLLFAMQVAILALARNSSPSDILMWRPEATVSEEELQHARAVQAADLAETTRLGWLSFRAYGAGLVAFLLGVVLLMIPDRWNLGWAIGLGASSGALLIELWWLAAN